jgi:hypothetical protein
MRVEQMALMIPIISTIGLFIMIIFLRYYSNTERMAMIERGMNPGDLKGDIFRRLRDPHRAIRVAFTAIGIGLGLMLSGMVRSIFNSMNASFGIILICGGLGLFFGYFVQMALAKKEKAEGNLKDENEV